MKIFNQHGFVVLSELALAPGGGVQVEYQQGQLWLPASIMPNLSEETLFAPSNNQDWNFATCFMGLVPERLVRDDRVYWNYVINFNGVPETAQKLRVKRFEAGGANCRCEEFTVTADPGDTVIINRWQEWQGAPVGIYDHMNNWRTVDPTDVAPGWYVASDEFGCPRLCQFGMAPVPELHYKPGVSGRYELYLCFREQTLECQLGVPGGKTIDILLTPRMLPTTRFVKEFRVGEYDFTADDELTIAQPIAGIYNKLRRFGDICYLKLVPATGKKAVRPIPAALETVFYAEPYSIAYYHKLPDPDAVAKLADVYADLGVDKLICQTGRTGSIMMHRSQIAARRVIGATGGDDRQSSNGAALMLAKMDVIAELARQCRTRKIKFLPNIALNSPYPHTALSSDWSEAHPEYFHAYHKLFLDFNRPEVIDYASEQFRELAEAYTIDGLSIGYTRYPYGQTTETLVTLHRAIVEKIGAKRRSELEINVATMADVPEVYAALEILLAENLIDSLCVGNMMSLYPIPNLKPYIDLAGRYGKKVYGTIDGWTPNHTGLNESPLPRPAECAELARHYCRQGADGFYFYQSEQILSNPFLCRFVQSLKA